MSILRFGVVAAIAAMIGWAQPAAAKRVALVVGNSAYEHATALPNPRNDATLIASSLRRLNFDVVSGLDLGFRDFGRKIKEFRRKLEGADVALLFFAGHGLQVKGQNYLIPVDAELEEELDLSYQAVRLNSVLSEMERMASTKLVFLDACRDNPLARTLYRSMGATRSQGTEPQGLARVNTASGTMIAFATEPGDVALDGKGTNSPFTTALAKHIESPDVDVAQMMRRVRKDVIDSTGSRQTPWTSSSLTDDFYFNKRQLKVASANRQISVESAPQQQQTTAQPAVPQTTSLVPHNSALELSAWDAIKNSGNIYLFESFLTAYPNGNFAVLAKALISELKKKEAKNAAIAAATVKQQTAQATTQQQDTKVASLPEETRTTGPAPVETHSPQVLATMLQRALKTAGCYVMTVDGKWGNGSRRAMQNFNRYANLSLPADPPTSKSVVDTVLAHYRDGGSQRICPVTCGRGTVLRGGRCIAVKRPATNKRRATTRNTSRQQRPPQQRQARPAPRPAPEPEPQQRRGTFSIGIGIGSGLGGGIRF